MGVQRVIVHEGLFAPKCYVPLVAALEGDPLSTSKRSADHLGEVRVYAFLPGFGPPIGSGAARPAQACAA